jgi:hypothetical protein
MGHIAFTDAALRVTPERHNVPDTRVLIRFYHRVHLAA